MILFICTMENTEGSRLMMARGLGQGKWGVTAEGTGFQFEMMKCFGSR